MRWFRTNWVIGCSLLLLLWVGLVQSKEPQTYPPNGTLEFLGLDDTSAPTQVQDGRAQDLQNVTLDVSEGVRQRFGYSLVAGTLDQGVQADTKTDFPVCAVTGLYYTKFSTGTDRIITTCGNRFAYLNGTTWTTVSGQTVTITAGQDNQFVFATALDEVIGTNAVNAPIRYNNSTLDVVNFTSLTSTSRPTTAKTVAFFKNFLIFGNTTENGVAKPTRIRWSNVGTTTTWSNADFIDIGALGGQSINAMAELYDHLYIFLTDSIYRLSFVAGADTFQVSKVTDDIGCIAKNSVQSITLSNAQNGLVFLDKDKKVYFFDGITVKDISQFITHTLDGFSASRLQYAVSADTNTDYLLCLTNGSGGTNDTCLELEYQIGEWTKHKDIPANAMAHVLDNNGRDQVYFGSYRSFVYQWADEDLIDDVATAFGKVRSVSGYDTSFASGLQILYVDGANYTTNFFAGAPIRLTEETTVTGQLSTIVYNTTTGLVVSDTYGTDVTGGLTRFEVGAIDSFYTTKWYDLGQAARLKQFGEVYFWAQAEDTSSGLTVSYATDLSADIASQTISLSADTGDAIWGSATWGSSRWGSGSDVFRQVKLSGEGRYLRLKFAEDDPNESFHLYRWIPVYWQGDIF